MNSTIKNPNNYRWIILAVCFFTITFTNGLTLGGLVVFDRELLNYLSEVTGGEILRQELKLKDAITLWSTAVFAFIAGVFTDFMEINVREYANHIHDSHISYFSYFCVFTLLLILGFCILDKKKLEERKNSIKIKIQGMKCSHCESSVVSALLSLEEVDSVQASHQSGEVILEGSNYDTNKFKEVIDSLNYKIISK